VKKSFLISLLILSACIKPAEPPVGTIPKDTMTSILVDIHLAEAKVGMRNRPLDSARLYYEVYKDKIYEKYKITPERFDQSMNFYVSNVRQLDEIYGRVVDSLGKRESQKKLD
jgi:hypothetical protein